jgi:hypothetical protein
MTTNVYDIGAGYLTTDSRWSIKNGDWVAYVDDTGYDKLVFDEQIAILFAGDLLKIDVWKQWFIEGRTGEYPDLHDGMSLIIVDMSDGSSQFTADYLLKSIEGDLLKALYAGTGAPHAKDCWQVNKCAKKAINSAIEADIFSGGLVVELLRENAQSNVKNSAKVDKVMYEMKERGIMTNVVTNITMHVKDAANDGVTGDAKDFANKVVAGSLAISAPFPGINQPWTNDKKRELISVLDKYKRN